jgi:hypothetical protein
MSNRDLLAIAEAVDELVEPREHSEPRTVRDDNGTWVTTQHRTHVPSLLEQLSEALEPGGTGDTGRAVPGSRPSARVDAMDVEQRIDQAAYLWAKTYATDRRWDPLPSRLRALVGVAGWIETEEQHQLAVEVRRWATWARVVTGWEVPPFRPDNTCPLCASRGGLRVRAGDGVTSTEAHALCLDCGEAWDPSTIGLLAEHIRAENGDEAVSA